MICLHCEMSDMQDGRWTMDEHFSLLLQLQHTSLHKLSHQAFCADLSRVNSGLRNGKVRNFRRRSLGGIGFRNRILVGCG